MTTKSQEHQNLIQALNKKYCLVYCGRDSGINKLITNELGEKKEKSQKKEG